MTTDDGDLLTSDDVPTTLPLREVARVLLLTADGQLLLVRYPEDLASSPPRPAFWVAPGGALQPGESFRDAAVREVQEETGVVLEQLGPHVWTRELRLTAGGVLVAQQEQLFLARLPEACAVSSGDEREGITEVRWWSIASLIASSEMFFPAVLPALVRDLAEGRIPATPLALIE